jgi:death-on-curing protein
LVPFEEFGVVYLEVDDVIEAYAEIFECSEQAARDQLRSQPALESACGRPIQWAAYGRADIALQAAVLAHGIAETQPFIDGNKRAAVVGMELFLNYNGYELAASDDELLEWVLALSDKLSPEQFGDLIRPRVVPVVDL